MLIFEKKLINVLQYAFFGVVCLFALFLFKSEHTLLKTLFYTFFIIALLSSYNKPLFLSNVRGFKYFILPWCPLLISIFVLILARGQSSGFSTYFHAFLILIISFIGLAGLDIKRTWIYYVFSISVILITLLILFDIFQNGLHSMIMGVNKNRLIPELTMLTSTIITAFLIDHEKFSPLLKGITLIAIFLNIISIIFTEVRTALLVYISLVPFLWLCNKKRFIRLSPYLLSIIFFLVTAFLITGRLQQGLNDFILYSTGDSNSSWGIRLELWKLSIEGFFVKPFLGWGKDAFESMINYGLPYGVPEFQASNFHSDFFNLLATSGIVGLLGTVFTIGLLIKDSLTDLPRLSYIISSLVVGIPGLCWSSNSTAIYLLMIGWLLLYLSSNQFNLRSK